MKGNERYERYQELAASNPYLVARQELGWTQEDVATRADITTQYVRRHEQGTINTPSGSLDALLNVDPVKFYDWQHAMRLAVAPALTNLYFENCRVDSWSSQHPFKFVMAVVQLRINHYFGTIEHNQRPTDNQFTKYTVQHPRNWQLYLKKSTSRMNPELRDVMEDLRIEWEIIEREVAQWLKK